jgi:hypothetical protein
MKKSSLFRILCVLVTSVVLICTPDSSFAAGGHGGGGGGFHGGGGGGFHGAGGGFHGGGFGGYHGGWGGTGWRGGYGWRGGWGYGGRGWGYPGWGRGWGWGYPGWGWGVGIGFGWGWGSYWGGYPYAYGYPYPYSYYPYYPYYPNYGPDASAPANPDRFSGGNRDPQDNSQQQDSAYPGPDKSTGINDQMPATKFVNHKTAHKTTDDTGSANYWLTNYQQHTVPRQQVRNVIQALLAMPPEARRRQVESGRYQNFSPEEQELLNQVAHVSPREPQKNVDETKPVLLRLTSR